jgi:hypothetical protein
MRMAIMSHKRLGLLVARRSSLAIAIAVIRVVLVHTRNFAILPYYL